MSGGGGATRDVWRLPGRFGEEEWLPGGAGFGSVRLAGQEIALPADPAVLDRIGARDTGCEHPGPMPEAFNFCVACGAPLRPAAAPDRSQPWSPPFGAADGLPEVEVGGEPDPGSGEEIRVPLSASLCFAVAGTPSRLLCLDRASGWVSAFSERDRDWHRLVQGPPMAALPAHGFAAAASRDALVLPSDAGPLRIDLRAPAGAATRLAEGTPVGGAGRIGDVVLVPLARDGRLALARLDDRDWSLLPVRDAPAWNGDALARPAGWPDGIDWCGNAGHLSVRDTMDGLAARWSPWPDGLSPVPGARPVAGRDGTLHQLCRLDPETLVHEALSGSAPQRRVARGYAPGTGRAVFRENTRLRLPWDERPACDYPLRDDGFLLPLLRLGGDRFLLAVCEGRDRLGRLLRDPLFGSDPAAEEPVRCTLHYSRGPRTLQPLDCVLRARSADDLSVLVHGRHLLVHGAVENRLHRWTLRDAA